MRLVLIVFAALVMACPDPGAGVQQPASHDEEPRSETDRAGLSEEGVSESDRPPRDQKVEQNVTISSPVDGSTFGANPISVSGTARTFENNVVLEIYDSEGRGIRQTSTTARGDLGNFNPWSSEIWVTRWPGEELEIRAVEYSARDGSVRSSDSVTLRNRTEPIEVTLYFSTEAPGNDCSAVTAVVRRAPKTQAMARLLVEMLLGGPTEEEKSRGVSSEIPRGARVESIGLRDGVVTVDFSPDMQNIGGSCRVTAIRSSLERTLLQLPTIDSVRITAGGSEALALQP